MSTERATSFNSSCRSRWPQLVRLLAWFGMLVTLACPVQADEDATARRLFEEGLELIEAGQVDEACAKFAESLRIQPAVGPSLNLARCNQLQGKTATAWQEFERAARLARLAGDKQREEAALRFAAELEPTVSRLVIRVEEPVAGMRVTRDGVEVSAESLEAPVAVDPGKHEVAAAAPEREPWSTTITIGADGQQETVTIPPLAPAKRDEPGGAPLRAPAPDQFPTALQTGGFVVGAVGVALVAVGVVLGVVVLDDADTAETDGTLCPDRQCYPEGDEFIDDAQLKADLATAALVVGGAAILGGALMILLGGDDAAADAPADASRARLELVPTAGPAGGALTLTGVF